MRLIIGEFKNNIGHNKDKCSVKSMTAYLREMLDGFGVVPTHPIIDTEGKNIILCMTPGERKLFTSKEENLIKLTPGDKRIKEDGKDFLKSKFLTKKQFTSLKRSLATGFQAIGIDCTIYLDVEFSPPVSNELILDTAKGINEINKLNVLQKNFPITKETYEQSKTIVKKSILDSVAPNI